MLKQIVIIQGPSGLVNLQVLNDEILIVNAPTRSSYGQGTMILDSESINVKSSICSFTLNYTWNLTHLETVFSVVQGGPVVTMLDLDRAHSKTTPAQTKDKSKVERVSHYNHIKDLYSLKAELRTKIQACPRITLFEQLTMVPSIGYEKIYSLMYLLTKLLTIFDEGLSTRRKGVPARILEALLVRFPQWSIVKIENQPMGIKHNTAIKMTLSWYFSGMCSAQKAFLNHFSGEIYGLTALTWLLVSLLFPYRKNRQLIVTAFGVGLFAVCLFLCGEISSLSSEKTFAGLKSCFLWLYGNREIQMSKSREHRIANTSELNLPLRYLNSSHVYSYFMSHLERMSISRRLSVRTISTSIRKIIEASITEWDCLAALTFAVIKASLYLGNHFQASLLFLYLEYTAYVLYWGFIFFYKLQLVKSLYKIAIRQLYILASTICTQLVQAGFYFNHILDALSEYYRSPIMLYILPILTASCVFLKLFSSMCKTSIELFHLLNNNSYNPVKKRKDTYFLERDQILISVLVLLLYLLAIINMIFFCGLSLAMIVLTHTILFFRRFLWFLQYDLQSIKAWKYKINHGHLSITLEDVSRWDKVEFALQMSLEEFKQLFSSFLQG